MSFRFALVVDGREITNWASCTWSSTVEAFCSSFTATARIKGSDAPEEWGLIEGAMCNLSLAREELLDGSIESVTRAVDPNGGITYTISGRDSGSPVVDSSVDLGGVWEFENISALDVAEKVAAAFGLSVIDSTGGALRKKIAKVSAHPGTTGHALLEETLRYSGAFARYTPGAIELFRPGQRSAEFRVEQAPPYIGGETAYDTSQVFHRYRVISADRWSGVSADGEATDETVTNKRRVLIMQAERSSTAEEARDRAEWERSIRSSRAFTANLRLRGAGPTETRVWRSGDSVGVDIPKLKLKSDGLVLGSVSITQDGSGTHSALGLRLPGAFAPEPPSKEVRA